MALRVDWHGLDDVLTFADARHAAAPASVESETPQSAGPARSFVVAVGDTPLVSGIDGFGSSEPDAFVPPTEQGLHGLPVVGPSPQTFTQADEVAFISGVYADGTLPLYGYYAWNNDNPATYGGGQTNSSKWGAGTAHTPGGTVSYYFSPGSSWSPTEKSLFVAGLSLWSDVANISFAETSNGVSAQIVFTRGSDGQAVTNTSYTGAAGAGATGGSVLWSLTRAGISIDTHIGGFGPIQDFTTAGGYPIQTLLHEEGHALGLGHAGPYNGDVIESQQQFSPYDTRLWSIMSYIEPSTTSSIYYNQYPVQGADWGRAIDGYRNDPTGLMPLDILAVQALYGAPTSTPLSGGQVFGFHSNVTGPSGIFFDFTQNTNPILTLWDAGTNNTLDISGWSQASAINLNPGTFSSAHGMIDNLAIAFGTQIDLFVGGGGSDTVTGNNDGDTFTGNGGNDTFTGGTGNDLVVYSGNHADYTITDLGGGSFRITDNRAGSPDGMDTTNAVEQGKFADDTFTLSGGAVNAAPAVGGAGNSTAYTEQAAGVVINTALTVTDADSALLTGATVAISAGFVAGDVLNFVNQAGITGNFDSATHVLTLSGSASVAAYQTALRSVTFSSTSDNPTVFGGSASRTIAWQVSDGLANSLATNSTVNVTAVDDAPALGSTGNIAGYAEQAAGSAVNTGLTLADADNTTLAGATVTIGAGFLAGDALGFANQSGITGSYNAGTHVLTLSGAASLFAYQAALRSVTFSSSSDNPTNYGGITNRVISFVVNDGTLGSAAGNSTVAITGVNDAPQVAVVANLAHYTEQGASAVLDSALLLSDVDNVALTGATVRIASGFVAGDTLNFVNQNGITGSYNAATHALTLSGAASLFAYQTALRSVTFSSPSDNPTALGANPNRLINWQVDDGQGVNHASLAGATSLGITAIDDPATLHNGAVATGETTAIGAGLNVFFNNGLGAASDPDSALRVTAVNGSAASVGHQITLASGALLTVNADGTFAYNPNHAFDYLAGPASGASNLSALDRFTYSDGGVTAVMNVTVSGIDSNDTLRGTTGDNVFDGGAGTDRLMFTDIESRSAVVYNASTQTFTFTGPDGHDTVKNVELFVFGDGIYNFDFGLAPWAARGIAVDTAGSTVRQITVLDNGFRWVNQVDTTNSVNWLWESTKLDVTGNHLLQQVGTTDVGTHWLTVWTSDTTSWSLTFDSHWNITGQSGAVDLNFYRTGEWYKTPYDPDHGSAPLSGNLVGGGNTDVFYSFGANDILSTGGGNDVLDGGTGNDTLTGGAGADRFIFATGDGLDTITDFIPGTDHIELDGYAGVASFASLQPLMSQSGADTIIRFDASNVITLHNVTLAQLHAGDFIFS